MSVTSTATLNVNATQAIQSLQKVQKQVDTLGSTFTKLRNIVGGLALGSFVTNMLQAADAMDDVAESTGLALTSVLSFSEAVRQNGGDTNDAVSAMQKFVLSLQEARDGSIEAQQAFNALGISTQELGQDQTILFNKAIQGFGNITKATEQAKIKQELFGKSLRSTNLTGVASGYAAISIEQREYAQATKEAADAQKEINKFIIILQSSLLPVAKLLGDVAKGLNESKESIKKFIEVGLEIAKVVAIFFAVYRVAQLLISGFALLSGGISALVAAVRGFGTTFSAFVNQMKGLAKEGTVTDATFRGLAKRWQYLKRDIPIISTGIAAITAGVYGLYSAVKKYLGIAEDFSKPLLIQGEGAVKAPTGFDDLLQYFKARREETEKVRQVDEENKKIIRQVSDAYNQESEAILRNLELTKMSLTVSADELELQTALIENSERLRKQLEDLEKQRQAALADPKKASLAPVYEEEMIKVRENAAATQDAIRIKIQGIQALRDEQDKIIKQNELMKNQMESDLALNQLRDQIQLIGLIGTELEDQQIILEVSQNLERELLALRERELELIARKGQLTTEQFNKELAQINALRNAASERANKELDIRREQKEKERDLENSYTQGVIQGLKDIKDQYKPINVAQDMVKKGWGALENAVDTFVETGKFKFGDFARSVIADLAKIIAKAAILQGIKAALGAFGFSLPGLAEGGPAKGGQPYIVGEKGPELFVPQGSGTVIPNNKLNSAMGSNNTNAGPVTNNYITNNISALDAKSVAQLFAENRKAIFGANKMAEREMSYAGVR